MVWVTRQRSGFGSLAAIRSGRGVNLLLQHGVGLRAEAWNGQLDGLSEHFEMVAPDMPGHGESLFVEGLKTLGDYTDQIANAITEPWLVAGHSMGALMALDLAIRYPDKVLAVAALNAFYRRSNEARTAMQARADKLDGVSVADPSSTLERWFKHTESAERAACRSWLSGIDPAAYRVAYTALTREDGPPDSALNSLHCPALFMTGTEETNSLPAMSRAMAERAPHGKAVIVADAAHMMPMTHASIVNETLRRFFQPRDA